MAASTSTSLLISISLIILITASMQLFKNNLASNEMMTIIGGLLGSFLFTILITAIGNLEKILFGQGFQTKLFPEVIFSLLVSMFASALIHRVSASTCLIFSLIALYYINRVSHSIYNTPQQIAVSNAQIKKKK